MSSLLNTLASEQFWAFWALLLVCIAERLIPFQDKYHPFSLVRLMADNMATKVLPSQPRLPNQQIIAGFLASLVLMLPICTVMFLFIFLSQHPIFFDSLMLLIALRFQDVATQTRKVTSALSANKKILAREMLSPLVLRETDKLSAIGVVKANIEAVLLRFSYQFCTVIFWYVLLGGAGALIYRLLYELSQHWNNKLLRFKYFGKPIKVLVMALQWLPSIVASLSLILGTNARLGCKALTQPRNYPTIPMLILHTAGAGMNIQLGGPAFYNQKKIRAPQCGGVRQVALNDNKRVLEATNRASWILITSVFIGYVLFTI